MALDLRSIQALPPGQLAFEIERGGRLVVFQYCISVLVMSFKRNSQVYLVQVDENAMSKHLPYTLLTLFLGWWGIPWGFIWTPQVIYKNFKGGIDITNSIQIPKAQPAAVPPPPAGAFRG